MFMIARLSLLFTSLRKVTSFKNLAVEDIYLTTWKLLERPSGYQAKAKRICNKTMFACIYPSIYIDYSSEV